MGKEVELYRIAIGVLAGVVSILAGALVALWKRGNKKTDIIIELSQQGGNINAILEKILSLIEVVMERRKRRRA